jgi:hypothetical protein
MYQNSKVEGDTPGAGTSWFTLNTAPSELSNATGWTVEVREQIIDSSGFGAAMWAGDNKGLVSMNFSNARVDFFEGQFDASSGDYSLSSGYHTFKISVAPGDNAAEIFLDGGASSIKRIALNRASGGTSLGFGDIAGSGWAQANWDYVKVNAVPEPSSVAILVTAMLGLVAYAWRKRK